MFEHHFAAGTISFSTFAAGLRRCADFRAHAGSRRAEGPCLGKAAASCSSQPSLAHGRRHFGDPSVAAAGPGQNCARLLSLADGANGAPPCRVPASSADGPHGLGGLPILRAGAVRRCSHFALSPTTSSRAAVTAATPSKASGLTAVPAQNLPRSAGAGAAIPADLPAAVGASAASLVFASPITANASIHSSIHRVLIAHLPAISVGNEDANSTATPA
jgi:hypothetical protein